MCQQHGQQSTEHKAPVLSMVAPDFVQTRHTVCGSFVRKSKIQCVQAHEGEFFTLAAGG